MIALTTPKGQLQLVYLLEKEDLGETGQQLLQGLWQSPKTISPRYFYDAKGSDLFEQICELPEYYLTRTEAQILQDYAPAIAEITGNAELIELGSGSSTKTRFLLDAYRQFGQLDYVPVDVSASIVELAAGRLLQEYDNLLITGLIGTYEQAIAHLVRECKIELIATENPENPLEVWINNHNVTDEIRSREVTAKVSGVSGQSAVRQFLVREQQKWGEKGGLVAEGRDIGTDVFPNAEVKIFLTASVEERARRRQQDLIKQGRGEISLEQLQREIQERDEKDSTREISPLRKAPDALEIVSDGLSAEEVTEKIVDCYY